MLVRLAGGWCLFVLREKYFWLVAGGWFVLREKYCCLVADKPNEFRMEAARRVGGFVGDGAGRRRVVGLGGWSAEGETCLVVRIRRGGLNFFKVVVG
jgi:hypothetical protein